MKNLSNKVINYLFSIFISLAIFGGGVVFLMFVIALVFGGEVGNSLALMVKNETMPLFIRFASIGTLAGLIVSYINNNHELTIEEKNNSINHTA